MPRNGQGVYSLPPNTAAVAGQTIESAPYNTVNNDIANDLNAARPITAGGTGASNAEDALANLGGVGQTNLLDAFTIGDGFYTARTLDARWLKRDGTLYDAATYPDLAALLPSLPDGVDWSSRSVFSSGTAYSILEADGQFILMVRDGSATKVYRSTDAVSWSVVATIAAFSVLSVAFGNNIYVAVDGNGKASVSNDAVSWSTPATISGFTFAGGVAFASAVNLFAVCGDAGKISTSPDGVSWTSRTSGVAANLFNVRYVNNTLIAVGASGAMTTSTNATAWTSRTTGTSAQLNDVAYGASTYVAVGDSGTIITSSNLTAWTARTSGTSQSLLGADYSTAGFIVVGGGGVARISSAGTSWVAAATGVSYSLRDVAADLDSPSTYYAVGDGFLVGIRTLTTQFRVPNDGTSPIYGWIKALDELP